jgi:hypothetical protein
MKSRGFLEETVSMDSELEEGSIVFGIGGNNGAPPGSSGKGENFGSSGSGGRKPWPPVDGIGGRSDLRGGS